MISTRPELAVGGGCVTASYAEAAEELVKLALEQRFHWSDDRKGVFDTSSTICATRIDVAAEGRPRQKA